VVDGVVYVGSSDGNVYAIGLSEAEVMAANATATQEQANSNATATQQTANRNSTATIVAIPTATYEAKEAEWGGYFFDIGFNLQWLAENSPDFPRGLAFDDDEPMAGDDFGDRSAVYGASFTENSSGLALNGVGVGIFATDAEAAAWVRDTIDGQLRVGWKKVASDRIDGDHTCLALADNDGVYAICYAQRGRVVISGFSTLQVDAPDAVLMNAGDLTQMGLLATRDLAIPD